MSNVCFLGFYLLLVGTCIGEYSKWDTKRQLLCPGLYPKIFNDYAPLANLTVSLVRYIPKSGVNGIKQCTADCCKDLECNVAMMHNSTCYNVRCTNSKMCTPLYRPALANNNPPSMVLVKPVEEDEDWAEILDQIDGTK